MLRDAGDAPVDVGGLNVSIILRRPDVPQSLSPDMDTEGFETLCLSRLQSRQKDVEAAVGGEDDTTGGRGPGEDETVGVVSFRRVLEETSFRVTQGGMVEVEDVNVGEKVIFLGQKAPVHVS